MGIQYKGGLLHWNYFLALENDLERLSRFVEFSEQNFNVYSMELAHLYLATCSEIDVVLKALCQIKDKRRKHWVINNYYETIKKHYPSLLAEHIQIPRFGLSLTPFESWSEEVSPLWWSSHNKVKHQRNNHYAEANLKNVLNSVSALAVSTLYYYKELFQIENAEITFKNTTRKLIPESVLVKFNNEYYNGYLLLE